MSRSLKKEPFADEYIFKKIEKMEKEGKKRPIKTWSRRSTIFPEFIDYTFEVHTGNKFQKVFITEDMVGHKLGEFAPTRRFGGHGDDKKKAKKGK